MHVIETVGGVLMWMSAIALLGVFVEYLDEISARTAICVLLR